MLASLCVQQLVGFGVLPLACCLSGSAQDLLVTHLCSMSGVQL